MELKICCKCKEEKSVKDFHWQNKAKGYRQPWCKECRKQRYQENIEHRKEYYQVNKEREKKRTRKQYKDNPEKYKECVRKWQGANPERVKEYNRKHYLANKEYYNELARKYHSANKECANEYSRKWNKDNPDKVNALSAKKRARKLNQTPELTENEKDKITMLYRISEYLGTGWQVDHIHPISKGGSHTIDNLQVVTKEYNQQKHNNENFRKPTTLEYFRI